MDSGAIGHRTSLLMFSYGSFPPEGGNNPQDAPAEMGPPGPS